MSAPHVAYLADGEVHLLSEDGTEETITSAFVEDVRRREASIERKTGWKTKGTGAKFMGAAALWDDAEGRRSPATFTSVSRGRRRGEILYAITTGPVSGLFAYDVATRDEVRLVHGTDGAPLAIATSDDVSRTRGSGTSTSSRCGTPASLFRPPATRAPAISTRAS